MKLRTNKYSAISMLLAFRKGFDFFVLLFFIELCCIPFSCFSLSLSFFLFLVYVNATTKYIPQIHLYNYLENII